MSQVSEQKIKSPEIQKGAPEHVFTPEPHLVLLSDMAGYDPYEEIIHYRRFAICTAEDFDDVCNRLKLYRNEGFAPVDALTRSDLLRLLSALEQESLEAVGLSDIQNERL